MGILSFFRKITSKTNESKSLMHDIIISSNHDSSCLDENPKGKGEFGLVKTNPIPIYGIDKIPLYMEKLRYKYISKTDSGTITYNPVEFIRTSDSDQSEIGSKKPKTNPVASSTTSPNIQGNIDVYNLYSKEGEKLNKIYVNFYSLKTSNKVPKGFFHRDEIPD